MYKKILVPLDGSKLTKKALEHAEKLAKTYGAEIILFQVVPLIPIYGGLELGTPVIVDKKQRKAAEMDLTKLTEEMKTRGHKVTAIVKKGENVAVEIINFAKERGVVLVVMCTHDHSGITRWVLGSVAHKVLTQAETPVLLIHLRR